MGLVDQCVITLDGVDGSEWVIHGAGSKRSPVRLLEGSVGDLIDPPVSTTYKARVGQAGSQYRGHRVEERFIILDVIVFGDSGLDWGRTDSDFRKALAYDKDARIRVTTQLSGERYIHVRLSEQPEFNNDHDRGEQGAAMYTLTLVAADPFWRSDTFTDEFVFDGMNWCGDTITVDNPGDVDCWPKWVLAGRGRAILPDWDESHLLHIPYLNGGDGVVDTDPMEELLTTTNNTQAWAEMNGQFAMNPVPAYTRPTEVPVSINPLPRVDVVLPEAWSSVLCDGLMLWADEVGEEVATTATAGTLATQIRHILTTPPAGVPALSSQILNRLTVGYLTQQINATYGSVPNIVGTTVQVRLERRWTRPWGME